jgi:hypothetical protein
MTIDRILGLVALVLSSLGLMFQTTRPIGIAGLGAAAALLVWQIPMPGAVKYPLCSAVLAAFVGFGIYMWPKSESTPPAPSAATVLPLPPVLDLYMADFGLPPHVSGGGGGGTVTLSYFGYADMDFGDSTKLHFLYAVVQDFTNRSQFIVFFIPASAHTFDALNFLATGFRQYLDTAKHAAVGGTDPLTTVDSGELVFNGRIVLYHEDPVSGTKLPALYAEYQRLGLRPEFRSDNYSLAVRSASPGKVFPHYRMGATIPELVSPKLALH